MGEVMLNKASNGGQLSVAFFGKKECYKKITYKSAAFWQRYVL
jgi:hypothetical protein